MIYSSLASVLFLVSILFASSYQAHGSKFLNAMQPEGRNLRALEKRRLLNELEVEEEEEEEDLNQRLEDDEFIYNQMEQILAKRQIRQTPVPGVIRLRMTPAPNEPQPIYRLKQTPPPEMVPIRQTPAPPQPQYPYNLVDVPLRQTPRPLRLTPAPPVRPQGYPNEGEMSWEEMVWQRALARREMAERQRRYEQADNYESFS